MTTLQAERGLLSFSRDDRIGKVVVCGAGIVGMSVAIMLAQDGHQVTIVEADPDAAPTAPGAAWELWNRKGIAQFHQPHNLFARFRQVCDEELPGLTGQLLAAGCVRWSDADTGPGPGQLLRLLSA